MSISDKLTQIAENEQKVYDSGYSKAEYDWWDKLQSVANTAMNGYSYAFMYERWTNEVFKPVHDLAAKAYYMAFYNSYIGDIVGCLEQQGVKLDTSKAETLTYIFASCKSTRIPSVDTRSLKDNTKMQMMFYRCWMCHTIDTLILKDDGSQPFTQEFDECSRLENLTIEGVIGQNGFNVQWSTKLSHDSLMSIINALADYSADTSGTTWTVTLGSKNIAKLTEEEKMIAFMKGWDLA